MAKPLIGPDPIMNRITAAIMVVMFASKIVASARLKPASMAFNVDRPCRDSDICEQRKRMRRQSEWLGTGRVDVPLANSCGLFLRKRR